MEISWNFKLILWLRWQAYHSKLFTFCFCQLLLVEFYKWRICDSTVNQTSWLPWTMVPKKFFYSLDAVKVLLHLTLKPNHPDFQCHHICFLLFPFSFPPQLASEKFRQMINLIQELFFSGKMSITSALVAKQTSIKKTNKKNPLCKRWLLLSKKQNLNPNGIDLWISWLLL